MAKGKLTELAEFDVAEVSIVDRGANQKKRFPVFKSEQGMSEEVLKAVLETALDDESKIAEIFKELSEGGQAAITGALRLLNAYKDELPVDVMTGLAKLIDAAPPAKAEDEDEHKQDEEEDDEDDEDEEIDMSQKEITKGLEGLDPKAKTAVEAIFKAADERIAKAEERADQAEKNTVELAKALTTERDARVNREMVEKATEKYGSLGSPEVVGKVLKTLHDLDAGAAKTIETLLEQANERVQKSALLTEAGHAGTGDTGAGAWAKIEKAAVVFKTADPKMTDQAAQAAAITANPALYNEYLAEKEGAH